MLTYNRGSWGVYERIRTNLNYRVSLCRPDTASEYLRALYYYKSVYGINEYDDVYENIVKWLSYAQNENDGITEHNTAFNFYFLDGSKDYQKGKQLYQNDNGKIILNLCILYEQTKDERLIEMAKKSADYWLSVQQKQGYYYDKQVIIGRVRSDTPCMILWMMTAMFALYSITGNEDYKNSGYKAFNRMVKKYTLKDGRILSSYENNGSESWRPVSSENYIALLCYALSYKFTKDKKFLKQIDFIKDFCLSLIDDCGAILNNTDSTVNCSMNTARNLCDLVYTQGFAINAFVELYKVTGDKDWLIKGKKLSDFLISIQCFENDLNVDGGWRGSYNVKSKRYEGRCDQNNPIDEGGEYSLYVGWCALPIIFGMMKLDGLLKTTDIKV